jgi:pimeloyl-ACP methyl ester carboxylesterase
MLALLVLLGCLLSILLAGFLYQAIGAHFDWMRYSRPGRYVKTANGSKYYVLEKGTGGPTVLFEAGIAATNLNWREIQNTISNFNHTVSYDRGGLGWSSPAKTPRTPANICRELHEMLAAAGIKPPFVLVGHSFGGVVMRRYAALFPEEVLGIVLVDPMRLEEWPPLDCSKQPMIDRGAKLSRVAIPIARFGLARLAVTSLLCRSGRLSTRLAGAAGNGGKHVLARIKDEVGKMPQEVWPIVAAHWSRPGYYAGMSAHVLAVPDTVREMLVSEPIRRIPVILLTPGKSVALCEKGLAEIGDNVKQVIAHESAHWVHLDEPELVVDSIRGMVALATAEALAVNA